MTDTSGPTSERQFAIYDPTTSTWKMWPDCGLWGSIEYSETWPRTGCMSNGKAYAHPPSEPPITESESSSSPLLPTPEAKNSHAGPDYARTKRPRSGGDDLVTAITRLTTSAHTPPPSNDGNNALPQPPLPLD